MTVINGITLTTFEVAPDGSMVSINVTDASSKPGTLVLPSECLQAMIMSLPEMMQQALQRRYRDPSLRLVYPMADWRLEASTKPGEVILSLSTRDGFAVSFVLAAEQLERIAAAGQSAHHATTPLRN
jgi:hypothetical protein